MTVESAGIAYVSEPTSLQLDADAPLPEGLAEKTRGVETPKFVIGWREWLALPDLGILGIKAKVDTGARTSALHTHDYRVFQREGEDWVRFHLHPLRRRQKLELECEARVIDYREVKDSGGHIERRPFIRARATIGGFSWEIDLSLTNREGMKFRMLLGRVAVAGLFIVDPACSYLMGKSLAGQYSPPHP
ncbi:MAG: RimK/LysX family protein [Verrucomicrobiales bacterium]